MTRAAPDIRPKRAYDPVAGDDGARVLVDRLWPRGVRKDELKLTLWLKDIAPSTGLRQWFGHDPDRSRSSRDAIARSSMRMARRWEISKIC